MTYMATLASVTAGGHLDHYDLPDWETRSPVRVLHVAPRIFDWVDGEPATYDGSILLGTRTPLEHLELFFSELRCADRPPIADFKRMQPDKHGIWKCHPPTLRVFGWCYAPHSFVAVTAVLERAVKADKALYGEKMQEVRDFIATHKLEHTVLRGDHRAVFPPKG